VLASQIQKFSTVFTIGLSLARFWRAFGISGGGFETPNPPRYATTTQCTSYRRFGESVSLGNTGPSSSDCHMFGPLKQQLGCRWFHSSDEEEMAVREWSRMQGPDFCHNWTFKLEPRWEKCINMLADYVQKWYCTGMNVLHLTLWSLLIEFGWYR